MTRRKLPKGEFNKATSAPSTPFILTLMECFDIVSLPHLVIVSDFFCRTMPKKTRSIFLRLGSRK